MAARHTDREFESELKEIRDAFAEMAGTVSSMGRASIQALFGNNTNEAYRVIQTDDAVDQSEVLIENLCIGVIARRQPLGPDLRFILSVLKAVANLERVADLCVGIAERSIELSQEGSMPAEPEIEAMAEKALAMVDEAVGAFLASDETRAQALILEDRQVDAYQAQLFRSLMEAMRRADQTVSQLSRLMSIVGSLERIGDHAKNICEYTCYLASGRQVSHKQEHQARESGRPRGILFLCVQNSARSQMAEGLAAQMLPPETHVFSAGTSPATMINPAAVQVMQEIGIDISNQYPKRLTDIPLGKIDLVVTLCSEEVCINLPGEVRRLSWLLHDPAAIADEAERIAAFRAARDELQKRIGQLTTEHAE
jgi:phosphate transport system protein